MAMLKNNPILLILALIIIVVPAVTGQKSKVYKTFKDTRVINSHSSETLPAGKLDFRIGHRFGDIAGVSGGWPTFYGFESSSDVLTGFEYGLTNKFMVGINRCKGSGPLKQNVNGLAKLKFFDQEVDGNTSFTFSLLGLATYSTMQKSTSEGVLNFFAKSAHRFSYHVELVAGRKFSERFSFQVSGGVTHRNIVASNDQNSIVSIGAASRIQISKSIGLILEAKKPISNTRNGLEFMPIGVGFEWETGGGHVFQMNLTNATGISETDYIPYTNSDFRKGEFRLGFTISRLFSI